MNRGVAWCVAVFLLTIALAATAKTRTAFDPDSLVQRFVVYGAGRFEESRSGIGSPDEKVAFYDAIAAAGAQWIATGDPSALPRRRLVAASLALEVASNYPMPEQLKTVDAHVQNRRVSQLLGAWGAAALVSSGPKFPPFREVVRPDRIVAVRSPRINTRVEPGERAWFRAACATAWICDIEDPALSPPTLAQPPSFPLIPIALDRFPNDPFLGLARAKAELNHDVLANVLLHAQLPLPAEPARDAMGSAHWREDALRHFERLAKDPEVGAEAHLRAGYIVIRTGDRGAARRHFTEADQATSEPVVRYLSRLLAGSTWQTDKRLVEAEAAYRSALEAMPRARAASALLAGLLTNANHLEQAAALLDAAAPAIDDPWPSYFISDARAFPQMLERLHAEFR